MSDLDSAHVRLTQSAPVVLQWQYLADHTPEMYQPRVPFSACYLEPIGSSGNDWSSIRLSAVTDVHNSRDQITPGV